MVRELRRVPANWEHPKDKDGKYVLMFDIYYVDALMEWLSVETSLSREESRKFRKV